MIVKSFELDKLKSLIFNMHLIYGINEGIKEDIIKKYYLNNLEGDVLKYDEQEILINKNEFVSSILNKSLFENHKLMYEYSFPEGIHNCLEYLRLSNKQKHFFLI